MGWVTLIGVAIGLVACATSQGPDEGEAEAAFGDRLGGLTVEQQEGEGTRIVLEGLEDPVYTAYMSADPKALVLDLAAVSIAPDLEPVAVYDGLVEHVSITDFDAGAGSARLEVALAGDAEFDVLPGPMGLELTLRPAGTPVAEEQPVDPWAEEDAERLEAFEELSSEETSAAAAPPVDFTPPLASRLQSLEVRPTSEGVLLHLVADGTIGLTESFTLENPSRLVVDLPGLDSALPKSQYEVDSSKVKGVRIGAHADKVRVVLDGGADAAAFQSRNLWPATDGLLLTVGSGAELDELLAQAITASDALAASLAAASSEPTLVAEAAQAAQATDALADEEAGDPWVEPTGGEPMVEEAVDAEPAVAKATPSPAAAGESQVYGVHYDSQPDLDRVAVLSDSMLDYELLFPDPETAVLSLPRTRVAAGAAGRVPVEGGPISLLSVFQQPDVEVAEVRVVVKRAPGLEPTVTRRGSLLFLDFERGGPVAAAPPAFPNSGSAMTAADRMAFVDAPRGAAQQALDGSAPASEEGIALDDSPMEGSTAPAAAGDSLAFAGPGELEDPTAAPAAAPAPVTAPASLEPPAAVELLEEGGLIEGKEYVGRRISLDFKDVEIADVLRLIAEVSDLNLITGDEVSGQVTIRLVDVPWDQALDVILLTKGLGFVRVGNVLRIAPEDILKAEEEVRLQERRNKEKLVDLQVKLLPVNYADVQDMSKLVKRLLTSRGTVNTDDRTNTLILKDIPSVIDEATALVKAVDTQTPQVMIEAKIVEANLDFSRELGSEWAVGAEESADPFGGDAPNRLGSDDFRFIGENSIAFSNPITATPTAALSLGALLLDGDMNLDVKLAAAESSGDGKVISSPRVVTLDNKEAEIEQGVSIPFQTFEGGDAKLEFIDAVLSLKVTPHITADKSIIMSIEVTRNAPDDTVATPTGSPAISKAEAKTETLVKDGQTLVLGGIYTITKSQRESRVPYLHRIPILGNAFKSREVTDSKKELLIFVTPRIVMSGLASS